MYKFGLAALSLFCCLYLFASETNSHFATVDDSGKNVSSSGAGTNEYLPADQFAEGNWGAATNGVQLSLQFNKATYTNGEPIIATLLVRNVTNKMTSFVCSYVSNRDGPVRFIVTTDDNRSVEPVQFDSISPLKTNFLPATQRKFVERFDKDYYLTNGNYYARAYVMTDTPRVYAESAKVPIKIAP